MQEILYNNNNKIYKKYYTWHLNSSKFIEYIFSQFCLISVLSSDNIWKVSKDKIFGFISLLSRTLFKTFILLDTWVSNFLIISSTTPGGTYVDSCIPGLSYIVN